MKYLVVIFICYITSIQVISADAPLKKAFSEGIKASLKVVEYEKSQALTPIPKGYCATITGKEGSLDIWEEVKLESLALFLNLKPSLFESNLSNGDKKKVLCFQISQDKEESQAILKQVAKIYPKIDEYITKIEILPTKGIHRCIPGVGKYFKDQKNEIEILKKQLRPDVGEQPSSEEMMVLKEEQQREAEQKEKVVFDNNYTRVIRSKIPKVLYVYHETQRRSL